MEGALNEDITLVKLMAGQILTSELKAEIPKELEVLRKKFQAFCDTFSRVLDSLSALRLEGEIDEEKKKKRIKDIEELIGVGKNVRAVYETKILPVLRKQFIKKAERLMWETIYEILKRVF